MSTDRPEQYPEISSEESAIVPHDGPRAEWPKKIRMLSANELDRLTIDSAGRFYWDGRLVNYEIMQQQQHQEPQAEDSRVDPVDRDAFELMDRTALELSDRGGDTPPPPPQPAAPLVSVVETPRAAPEVRAVDLDAVPTAAVAPVTQVVASPASVVPAEHPSLAAPAVITSVVREPGEKLRVRLSFFQSIGALIAILCLLVATAGVAAHGFVTAHAWGCRIGLVKQYCPPPPPAPVVPPRPDIPA
jgi:hypothetical protein